MVMKILITENQFKGILNEYYDKDKLYHRETLVKKLLSKNYNGQFNAPKEIRDYVKTLPHMDCYNSKGEKDVCTRIPEVLYVYLSGRY